MPYLGNVPSSFNVGTNNIDNGAVTTEKIADGAVVNADVSASAAIAGTKISPDFGSQNLLTTGTATAASFIPSSSTAPTNGVYLPAANTVSISTNGSGRLFVDANGRIAIGGTTVTDVNLLNIQGSTATHNVGVVLNKTNGTAQVWGIQNNGSLAFFNYTASSTALTIDTSNRVGVGTSAPSGYIHIQGISTGTETYGRFTTGSAAGDQSLVIKSGSSRDHMAIQVSTNAGVADDLALQPDGGRVGIGSSAPGSILELKAATPVLTFNQTTANSAQGISFQNNGTEYGRILNNALTGILDIRNGLTSGAGYLIRFSTDGSTAMTIDSSQRVGIGTTAPAQKLEVQDGSISVGSSVNASTTNVLLAGYGYILSGTKYGNTSIRSTYSNYDNSASLEFYVASGSTSTNERMRLDTLGRLLVGTSTAFDSANTGTSWLVGVENPSNYTALSLKTNQASANGAYVNLGKSRGSSSNSKALVNNNDELGGIYFEGADGAAMRIGANISAFVDAAPGAGDMPTRLVFSTTADGSSSPTERMRISNSGIVTITGPQMNLSSVSGHAYLFVEAQNAASQNAYLYLSCPGSNAGGMYYERSTSRLYAWSQNIGTTGVYIASGGTSWSSLSDERQKDIIEPIENAADKVSSLRAVIGKYKTDEEGTRRSFLIAQDVQAVLPEAVSTEDPDSLGLAYTDVIPLLVAAIKEQQVMIADLQAKVAALESV